MANPFEEPQLRISEFTAQEIATLQSRLEKQLGPEYLSTRAGPSGAKLHYIAADKCITLANEVFGFNGWSSAIRDVTVDFVDENPHTQKVSLGLSVIMRVTLRDGTFHEDVGYGHMENCKGKAAAFEKAKKEGATDALKRALRSFGNVLGNCLYDKTYLAKVTKMKYEPVGVSEDRLHRHADYAKRPVGVKGEMAMGEAANAPGLPTAASFEDLMGEFDEADFNVVDDDEHPDMVALPAETDLASNQTMMQPPDRAFGRSVSHGNPPRPPRTPLNGQGQPSRHSVAGIQGANSGPPRQVAPPPRPDDLKGTDVVIPENVGFFSAKAVNKIAGPAEIDDSKLPTAPLAGQTFNPHAESPSIRKTPGVDHTKTKPLGRDGQHVAPVVQDTDSPATKGTASGHESNIPDGKIAPPAAAGPATRSASMNLQPNQMRRIGAPGGVGSPLANRGQYRPPTMKRPLGTDGAAMAQNGTGGANSPRPALAEVSTNAMPIGAAADARVDAKRQKLT